MMDKKVAYIGMGVVVLAAGLYAASMFFSKRVNAPTSNDIAVVSDPLNTVYTIAGKQVILLNGISEVPAAPGSAATVRTSVFGNFSYGDVNNDGKQDAALLLAQNSGGSGTFYYIAVALNVDGKYMGTNAFLLGDRIAPQNTEIRNGIIMANYADRKVGEPMTVKPSVGKTWYGVLNGNTLVELSASEAQNRL